jgi:ubiquinone/menaquinone biosynthesis C-methylase UbiE
MGIYADHIFPHLMEWAMGSPLMQEQRRLALERARGEVLEIGFGTGLNLPLYSTSVTAITAVDPAILLPKIVARRIVEAEKPVTLVHVGAEQLPFPDHRFDCVVSTWTLCTIADVSGALREIRRVVKSDGHFLFLEHGRSRDPRVARWQDRFNPLQQIIGCGCNLNRPMDILITQAGLRLQSLERYCLPNVPRLIGEMYRGIAAP